MKRTFSIIVFALLLTSVLTPVFNTRIVVAEPSTTMIPNDNHAIQETVNVADQEPPPTAWNKAYGGTGEESAHALVGTSDGGYALAGSTNSYGAGSYDFWLVKTDANGNMQWSKTYGGTGRDVANALVQTSEGGYALAGFTSSYGAGFEAFWLVKTDANGNMQWSKTYGGIGTDSASALVQTSEGGYALAGAGFANLVKTDADGNMQWAKSYGGASDALVVTTDGGYALAGSANSYGDFWLVKTDANGNMQWSKTYGGAFWESAHALVGTSDGGYALAGSTNSYGAGSYDFWLVKTDANGNMQWSKTYGGTGTDSASALVQTSEGGYALAGYTYSFAAGGDDFWLVKLAPESGQVQTKITSPYVYILSSSSVGIIPVDSVYCSMNIGRNLNYVFSIPEGENVEIWLTASLLAMSGQGITSTGTSLSVDGQAMSSFTSLVDPPGLINGTLVLNLPEGIHEGLLRFEGNSEYLPSSQNFKILAYKSTRNAAHAGFSVARDAYGFPNIGYSFEEHLELIRELQKKGVITSDLVVPLTIMFALLARGGHCFGMAASSSAYYLDASLKPKQSDTYALSWDEAELNINWYHLCQILWLARQENVSSSLSKVKSLIDSGTPVILGSSDIKHALTIIGYYENPADHEIFLVAYNNNDPHCMETYSIIGGEIKYFADAISNACFVDPHAIPPPFWPIDIINAFFTSYVGLQIHSPVSVNINSTSGKTLLIDNGMVVRNDFEDSYVYVSDSKIILLPSNEDYAIEAIGTAYGQVSLDCVFRSGGEIVVHQSPNITVTSGSKLYLPSLQSDALYVDMNGDGTIDQTVPIPELPSAQILSALMIFAVLVAVLSKKKWPKKP